MDKRRSFLFILPLLLYAVPACAQTDADTAAMMMEAISKAFNADGVEVKPNYTFAHGVRYRTEEVKWQETEKMDMTLRFNAGSMEIAMQASQEAEGHSIDLFTVFDMGTRSSVSFMHSDTMNVLMPMRIPDLGKEEEQEKIYFKATGKSRTIAGIEAREWVSRDNGDEVHLWIADAGIKDLAVVFQAFGKLNGKPALLYGDNDAGLVLAGSFRRKEEAMQYFTFEATEVMLNAPFTFSSEGYDRLH